LAAIDASIKKMVSSLSIKNKEAVDRGATMWKATLEKQDVKTRLEREKVEAAKMEFQAGVMKAKNEATRLSLAKMIQEFKTLMADMARMDPLARREGGDVGTSCGGVHGSIGTHACTSVHADNDIDEHGCVVSHASAGSTDEVPHVIANEVDVVEVQPPLTPFH
jgi:hypothetical protein